MPLLEGVYAAAVTPRRLGSQDINLGVMWDLIDFLCERKVQGIALLGATGEFVHYSASERMRMMGLAPKRSRVPVLINVSHSSLDGTVELAQAAAASGAAGVLAMPPYFYRYSDETISTFYRELAEQAEIEIPIMVYNIPEFASPVSLGVVRELLQDGVVHGVKDSSGDWEYLSSLIRARREQPYTLMVGNDRLCCRAIPEGVSGVISGTACALPELMMAVQRAIAGGDREAASRLDRRVAEFSERAEHMPVPIAIREATAARGFKVGPHATALSEHDQRITSEFREWFTGWLPDVLNECRDA
jgi:dihydrodipicolinate synthase/N-acetylneuraminate lyase